MILRGPVSEESVLGQTGLLKAPDQNRAGPRARSRALITPDLLTDSRLPVHFCCGSSYVECQLFTGRVHVQCVALLETPEAAIADYLDPYVTQALNGLKAFATATPGGDSTNLGLRIAVSQAFSRLWMLRRAKLRLRSAKPLESHGSRSQFH